MSPASARHVDSATSCTDCNAGFRNVPKAVRAGRDREEHLIQGPDRGALSSDHAVDDISKGGATWSMPSL